MDMYMLIMRCDCLLHCGSGRQMNVFLSWQRCSLIGILLSNIRVIAYVVNDYYVAVVIWCWPDLSHYYYNYCYFC